MITAASVLTVSATATRITAAMVAPTCGIRSRKPAIIASTIGNGRPSAHAETPATVPATIEIAMLPSSDCETASIDSSTTGRQRRSTAGGVKPNSHSVIVGRSISRNRARNVSVTSDSTEPNTPAARPSSAVAASGRPAARSFSASRTLSSASPSRSRSWNTGGAGSAPPSAGSWLTKSTIWSHSGRR